MEAPTIDTPVESFAKEAIKFLGQSPQDRMGLHTGFTELDRMTRGLHNGKLYTVAARPGGGKTSFGTSLAANIMRKRIFPVLFISTELTEEEIMLQIAEAYVRGVPVYPNDRRSSADEIQELTAALGELASQEGRGMLNVRHQKALDISEIGVMVSEINKDPTLPFLVIIDQASRVKRNDENGRRQYTVATEEMLNGLESMAHETQAAVMLMTQLNRGTEFQDKPMLSNLKHSGAFEEFSHCVLLLEKLKDHGNKTAGGRPVHHEARIHVAKNRHGPTGILEYEFRGECHTWREKG